MKQGLVVCFFLFTLFLLSNTPVNAFYACGGSPCNGSYPCNGGLTCNGSSVCGTYYNTCSGATCNATGGWDQASCNTPNQCTPSGTTRTAAWSAWGACSPACGPGTQTRTCNCASQNNCSVSCSSPAGACASTPSQACCTDQAPQIKPSITFCTQSGVTRTAQVDWTFTDTGSTCGQSWGYNCAGNSNSFQLRFNGGKSNENGLSTDRTLTTGVFPDWGTYTVQVCALNGVSENCSVTTNCVLTAPTCTATGQAGDALSDSTCRNTDPTLSASMASGADEIEFLVKQGSSTLTNPYAAQSAWLNTTPASYVPSLATNTYYWNTVSRSTAAPVACITPAVFPTGYQLNVDKTPPTTPVGAFTGFVADPACLSQYFVTYGWGASSDVGCGGLAALPYQAQIASDAGYSTLTDNINTASLSITSTASYLPATTLYGRVSAQDGAGNNSGWSVGTNVVIPQPSPFPTIHIQGNYIEDTGVCSNMTIDPNNLSLALNIVPATGVSSVCTKAGSSYGCDITIDNQSAACPVVSHDVSLVTSYAGYDAVEWRVGNVCAGAVNPSISISATSPPAGPIDANVYFDYGTTQSWFKTSGTSFTSKAARNNIIPNAPLAFDTDDSVAPPNNTYLTINEGGAVLYTDLGKKIELGPNAVNGFSAHNWYSNTYNATSIFTLTKFTDYMKSRKKYNTITDVANISADGIYYVNGDLSISNMVPFNNRKVVIVADSGTVTIAADMIPTSSSVAIIANAISINSAVTEVDAILIGNTVNIGVSATKLKINGNLIQLLGSPAFANTRVTVNAQSPSLFIKFNQAMYVDLLPYLSTSMYDWRQIQ